MNTRALNRFFGNRACLASLLLLVGLIIAAGLAPMVAPFSPTEQNLLARLQPPGFVTDTGHMHLLGTDQFGRDVLSRLIFGMRVPLVVGIASALLGGLIGLLMGLPAGYFGKSADSAISIVIDVQLSMPFVLIALLVVVLFGSSASTIILTFALLSWPTTARVARVEALRLRSTQFVEAAKVSGASHAYILLRHILPNALTPVIVVATVQVAQFIIYESAFGFFGLGIPPPEPTWGNMLSDARNYLRSTWWMGFFPGLGITIVALAANLLGDGLRDAFDPRDVTRA